MNLFKGLKYIKGFKNKILYILKIQPFCTKGIENYNHKCIRFELKEGSCIYCGATKDKYSWH
jgi:hypothetical protein